MSAPKRPKLHLASSRPSDKPEASADAASAQRDAAPATDPAAQPQRRTKADRPPKTRRSPNAPQTPPDDLGPVINPKRWQAHPPQPQTSQEKPANGPLKAIVLTAFAVAIAAAASLILLKKRLP